jgi:hypothetical protein
MPTALRGHVRHVKFITKSDPIQICAMPTALLRHVRHVNLIPKSSRTQICAMPTALRGHVRHVNLILKSDSIQNHGGTQGETFAQFPFVREVPHMPTQNAVGMALNSHGHF